MQSEGNGWSNVTNIWGKQGGHVSVTHMDTTNGFETKPGTTILCRLGRSGSFKAALGMPESCKLYA